MPSVLNWKRSQFLLFTSSKTQSQIQNQKTNLKTTDIKNYIEIIPWNCIPWKFANNGLDLKKLLLKKRKPIMKQRKAKRSKLENQQQDWNWKWVFEIVVARLDLSVQTLRQEKNYHSLDTLFSTNHDKNALTAKRLLMLIPKNTSVYRSMCTCISNQAAQGSLKWQSMASWSSDSLLLCNNGVSKNERDNFRMPNGENWEIKQKRRKIMNVFRKLRHD